MKKNISTLILISLLLSWPLAVFSVEVGDIFYHDGTFNKTLDSSKVPVGLVYWVSARRDHGYIMALDQPAKMNYTSAVSYCDSYITLGTTKGQWKLPNLMEGLRMGNEQINGVKNTKFTTLNSKLNTIPNGQQLVADQYYWIESRSGTLTTLNKYGFTSSTSTSAMNYPRCVKAF